MHKVSLIDQNNIEISLSNNKNFTIIKIEGIDPVDATINSNQLVSMIGSVFNSASVASRDITISLAINDYNSTTRRYLNNHFLPSSKCTVIIDNYSSEGYIESINYDSFEQKIIYQIGIKCLDPYFVIDVKKEYPITNSRAVFEFPASFPQEGIAFGEMKNNLNTEVVNNGDATVGCIIEAHFNAEVLGFQVYNLTTDTYFGISNHMFEEGQVLIIDSRFGKKSIYSYNAITGNVYSNLILDIDVACDWLEIIKGVNVINYSGMLLYENIANLIDVNISFNEKVSGL